MGGGHYDVYIIHDSSLTSRLENVDNIKERLSNCSMVHDISVVNQFDSKELNLNNVKNLIRTKKPDNMDEVEKLFDKFQRPITIPNISNYLKHVSALEAIVKNNRPGIVIEDDVIASDEMEKELESAAELFQNGITFFGQPFQSSPLSKFENLKNFNGNTMTLLPCIDSYVIDCTSAKTLIPDLLPIVYQTNIALSLAINRRKIGAFKMFPNVFIDGSKVGKYTSSINSNNILMFNSKYNKLYAMIQNDKVDVHKFNELFEAAEFNTSPDMIYMKALCYLKSGNIQESKKLFDQAYDKFYSDNCSLNKNSSFMCNYLKFFKILQ